MAILAAPHVQTSIAEEPLLLSWDSTPPLRSGPLAGYSDVVQKAAPSVVAVLIQVRDGFAGKVPMPPADGGILTMSRLLPDFETDAIGSGIILTANGYILTSSHVVESAEEIRVLLAGNEKPERAELIGIDELTDIAVIKIDSSDLPAARLAKGSVLSVGDVVLTIGNPFGLEHTVTSGIISGLGRKNLAGNPLENLIQTDAPINPGSSGGALIDNRGRVIGVTGAMISEDGHNAGIGFAEPIESAVEIARTLIASGQVRRGYIGASFSELTPRLAKFFGSPSAEGAVIVDVEMDSPAEKAGLIAGDVIVRFGDTPIAEPRQLELLIAEAQPGVAKEVGHIRYGESLSTKLEVVLMPSGRRSSGRAENLADGSAVFEGVVLAEIDPGARIYFGIPPEIRGVIVVQVDPGSAASRAGVAEGEVILQIGREQVASIAQAISARKKIDSGEVLLRILSWEGIKFTVLEQGETPN